MSTPALIRLRQANPRARISLLTSEKLADLWHGHSAIDKVITFNKSDGVLSMAARIKSEQFDAAVVFPNSFRSALEMWLARIPRRIGHGGRGRSFLLNEIIPRRTDVVTMRKRSVREIKSLVQNTCRDRQPYPISSHQLHHYLHLVRSLGANPDPLPPRIDLAQAELDSLRSRWNLPALPIVGLNPGAEYGPAKRWPTSHFIRTAHLIRKTTACSFVIFGGKNDFHTATEIETGLSSLPAPTPVFNLAGQTTLRELCAALALCTLVLTNDTGPMHLAAAVGVSVAVPFGSTSPELTGPGLPGSPQHTFLLGQAACAPCFRRECPVDFRCMLSITPDSVATACLEILNKNRHAFSSPI